MKNDIYALCDGELLKRYGVNLEDFVSFAKAFGAEIIQYRDKKADHQTKRDNLLKLRALWPKTLIINDEIALGNLCDGVHIGQEDLLDFTQKFALSKAEAVREIKKLIGNKIVGLSTHNAKEIEEANSFEVDYIGLGAFRTTTTKSDAKVLGENLSYLASGSLHRVVAIGGVRVFDNIEGVWLKAVGNDLFIKALTFL